MLVLLQGYSGRFERQRSLAFHCHDCKRQTSRETEGMKDKHKKEANKKALSGKTSTQSLSKSPSLSSEQPTLIQHPVWTSSPKITSQKGSYSNVKQRSHLPSFLAWNLSYTGPCLLLQVFFQFWINYILKQCMGLHQNGRTYPVQFPHVFLIVQFKPYTV